MKDDEQTAMFRQRSAHSKLTSMENQVSYLRSNILGKKINLNNDLREENKPLKRKCSMGKISQTPKKKSLAKNCKSSTKDGRTASQKR